MAQAAASETRARLQQERQARADASIVSLERIKKPNVSALQGAALGSAALAAFNGADLALTATVIVPAVSYLSLCRGLIGDTVRAAGELTVFCAASVGGAILPALEQVDLEEVGTLLGKTTEAAWASSKTVWSSATTLASSVLQEMEDRQMNNVLEDTQDQEGTHQDEDLDDLLFFVQTEEQLQQQLQQKLEEAERKEEQEMAQVHEAQEMAEVQGAQEMAQVQGLDAAVATSPSADNQPAQDDTVNKNELAIQEPLQNPDDPVLLEVQSTIDGLIQEIPVAAEEPAEVVLETPAITAEMVEEVMPELSPSEEVTAKKMLVNNPRTLPMDEKYRAQLHLYSILSAKQNGSISNQIPKHRTVRGFDRLADFQMRRETGKVND